MENVMAKGNVSEIEDAKITEVQNHVCVPVLNGLIFVKIHVTRMDWALMAAFAEQWLCHHRQRLLEVTIMLKINALHQVARL